MSMFRRVSQYGRSPDADPRENRLTEILAAVLDSPHCDGLARHLAYEWLNGATQATAQSALGRLLGDPRTPWHAAIRTQTSLFSDAGRRRPDLTMTFRQESGAGAGETCAAWVEVKHGTAPHSGQLKAYLQELRVRSGESGRVALLAPRADLTGFEPSEIPDEIVQVTWEDTGRLLQNFETDGPIGRFLIAELNAYLDEEGLMDPSELTTEHLAALANYQDGRHALERVCELAATQVDKLWAPGDEPGRYPERGNAAEFWWTYPQTATDGDTVAAAGGLWPTWELLVSGDYLFTDLPVGIPVFIAGVSGDRGATTALTGRARAALEREDFQVLPAGQTKSPDHEYVLQVRRVDDLLSRGPVTEQATKLADWVNAAFRAIAQALNTP